MKNRANEIEIWEQEKYKKREIVIPENTSELSESDNIEITFLNWVTRRTGWNKHVYLYGKARTREGKLINIRTYNPFCYLIFSDNLSIYEGIYDRKFDLGSFNIVNNIYKKGEDCVFNFTKEGYPKDMTLLVTKTPCPNIIDLTSGSFSGTQWYFVFNDIDPSGSYSFNTGDPRIKKISDTLYDILLMDFPFIPIPAFVPPVTILNFDLECFTLGTFSPQTNPITHCAITLIHSSHPREFCLIDTNSIPDWSNKKISNREDSIWCSGQTDFYKQYKRHKGIKYFFMSERNLLLLIKSFLESSDIDYVLTYNGHFMDIPYINKRLEIYGLSTLEMMSPENTESYPLQFVKSKSSNLLNTERFDLTSQNATVFFDLHNFVKKEELGLNSYSLESLSKKNFNGTGRCIEIEKDRIKCIFEKTKNKNISFLKRILKSSGFINFNQHCLKLYNKLFEEDSCSFWIEQIKRDPFELDKEYYFEFGKDNIEIDKIYKNYSLEIALDIAPYCQHDSNLCQFLWEKYNIPFKIKAASFLYRLPQNKILFWYATTTSKGPVLLHYMKQKTLYIEKISIPKIKYEGATVFDPVEKIIKEPVIVFDYNSLYPNSCIFGNLSPETLICHIQVSDSIKMQFCLDELRKIYPWPDYIVIKSGSVLHKYVGEILVYDRRHEGIIPALLKQFISLRKIYKKKMKEFPEDYNLYDNLQLVTKLSANSIYGLMGTNEFILKTIHSSKACTTIGREMLGYLDTVFSHTTFKPDGMYLDTDLTKIWKGIPLKRFYPSKEELIDCQIKRVYGDTDSIFTKLIYYTDGNVLTMASKIGRFFEHIINTEILFDQFVIEMEYILLNIILFSKKKYYGEKYSPFYKEGDQPVISGKGYKKRDMCSYYLDVAKKIDGMIKEQVKSGCTELDLRNSVVSYLLDEFRDIIDRQSNKVSNCSFYFTRKFGADSEKGENPNSKLIKKWNEANPNSAVNVGERFWYTYVCPKDLGWQTNIKNKRSFEYVLGSFNEDIPSNCRIFYEIILARICTRVFKSFEQDDKFAKTFVNKLFGSQGKHLKLNQMTNWARVTPELFL